MTLSEILAVSRKVDGRKHISNKVDLKASLFKISEDGKYEIHISCFFPVDEIEKVIENILANLKRLNVNHFSVGSKGDGSVDKVTLMKFCEKFILDEWHLSLFITVG